MISGTSKSLDPKVTRHGVPILATKVVSVDSGASVIVDFLVDTGADCSLLSLKDAMKLKLPNEYLERFTYRLQPAAGAEPLPCGMARVFLTVATSDGPESIPMLVLVDKSGRWRDQSILGRDVLSLFQLNVASTGRVELTPDYDRIDAATKDFTFTYADSKRAFKARLSPVFLTYSLVGAVVALATRLLT